MSETSTQPHVLVVGEALVDVVIAPDGGRREMAGGSAANVAVALARLGRSTRFVTAYAADRYGTIIEEHLNASGVALGADPHLVERSSSAEARLAEDGSATYAFDLDWSLRPVQADPLPRALHVCSIAAVLAPGAEEVLALVERLSGRCLISYDINMRPSITGTAPEVVARVERLAALVDVVKLSDEDVSSLYPALEVDEVAAHLLGLGAANVAITLGAEGAAWWDASGRTDVASVPVDVADTIGAGDTFSAATIDALWEDPDRDRGEVLAAAVRAAAVTVSRPGADPPWADELADRPLGGAEDPGAHRAPGPVS